MGDTDIHMNKELDIDIFLSKGMEQHIQKVIC